jgi:hypothetical protein
VYGEYMAGMRIEKDRGRFLSMCAWWRVEVELSNTAGSLGRAER